MEITGFGSSCCYPAVAATADCSADASMAVAATTAADAATDCSAAATAANGSSGSCCSPASAAAETTADADATTPAAKQDQGGLKAAPLMEGRLPAGPVFQYEENTVRNSIISRRLS